MIESFLDSIGLRKDISKYTSNSFVHIISSSTSMHEHFDVATKSKLRACFNFPIGTEEIPAKDVTESISFRYLGKEILYNLTFDDNSHQSYMAGEKSRGCLDNRFVHNPSYEHTGTIMSLVVKLVIFSLYHSFNQLKSI